MAEQRRGRRRDLDSPWKETLQFFLPAFLAFFVPRLHAAIDWSRGYEALDKEFQQVVRDARVGRRLADKLFRVWLHGGQEAWLLIHVEVQGGVERRFARRMFQYNYRCFDLYHRRVLSLALLCDDNPNWRPDRFRYGGWGSCMSLRFPSVKLLDYASRQEELAGHDNPVAQVVLAHLKAQETRQDPATRRHWKIQLVKGPYERGWAAEEVRQLFRLIDWLMELPPELQRGFRQELYDYEEQRHMPYVTSIERLAKEEGREEGREEGARQELLELIRTCLKDKFGAAGTRLMRKVRAVDDNSRLRTLARALMTADRLEAFRDLLD